MTKQTTKQRQETITKTWLACRQNIKMTFFDFPGRLRIQPPAPDEKTTRTWQNNDNRMIEHDNKMTTQRTNKWQHNEKKCRHKTGMTQNDKAERQRNDKTKLNIQQP
jgi:hypothetical protein